MRFHAGVLTILHLGGAALALPAIQKPLQDIVPTSLLEVRAELRKAEIIPTVIDDFLPSISLDVSWPKKDADLGNTIKPKHVQDRPSLSLYDDTNPDARTASNITYIITLTDPDAPSRDNPEWSEMCHWIASNISLSSKSYSILPAPFDSFAKVVKSGQSESESSALDEVIEYKPPGPPPKTGKHRYVFLVFAPSNGTTLPLDLSKPKDRQHWGYGKERKGVREWAQENGLVAVGANFIYSQNKKQ